MKPTQYVLRTEAFGLKPGTVFSLNERSDQYWAEIGGLIYLEKSIVERRPEHFKRIAPDFEALLTVFGKFQTILNVPPNAPEFLLPVQQEQHNFLLAEIAIPDSVSRKVAVFENTFKEDGWGRPIYAFARLQE